jgi:hypothetical protein
MKPQLLEIKDSAGIRHGWIVDSDKVFTSADRDTGRPVIHYPAAVDIGERRDGIARIDASGQLIEPRPCLFTCEGQPLKNDLRSRGILPQSAAALLRLAAAANSVVPDFSNDTWAFTAPRERHVPAPWDGWSWMIAWRFNWWHKNKMKGEAQHADLVAMGYAGTQGALRKSLSRLGLVTDRKR